MNIVTRSPTRRPTQTDITLDHVRKACALYDSGEAVPRRDVYSFLLVLDGKRYPAVFVYRLALTLARGNGADVHKGSSRNAAIGFFRRLGLETERDAMQLVRRFDSHSEGSKGRS